MISNSKTENVILLLSSVLFFLGLELCRWAGRNQIVKQPGVTYYVDGAHTPNSVQVRYNML